MLADMFWKCYDAICFGVALAILWHHCTGMARYAMLQSKRWLLSAMRQSGRTWTKLCCKTAWAAMASMLRAAGHWQHHTASMMQPRNRTLLSRTNTTAAELFYLRHMRSCAAAPMGNKGGSPSPSAALQISGADVVGRLLQNIWRHCYLTVFLPVGRLLQSIGQMVRYDATTAMKVITVSFAMLQDVLTWFTPLESAACFHLVNAYMHQDFPTHYRVANHCRLSEVSELSAPEIATTACALLILALSVTDWHVPQWLPRHQLLCKILTAVCMYTLRVDYACTTMAFLLPTFGKRPQEEGGAARKRTATMSPATEQTLGTPTDTNATMQNPQNGPPMQASSSAAESDAATEHIAAGAETIMSMQDIVTECSAFSTDDARDLIDAAQVILKGNQNDVRNLCKPWGVQLKAQKRYRPMDTIREELKTALTKRARKLKSETELVSGGAATEHAATEVRVDDAVAETLN